VVLDVEFIGPIDRCAVDGAREPEEVVPHPRRVPEDGQDALMKNPWHI
jgi:hypothetical protein